MCKVWEGAQGEAIFKVVRQAHWEEAAVVVVHLTPKTAETVVLARIGAVFTARVVVAEEVQIAILDPRFPATVDSSEAAVRAREGTTIPRLAAAPRA
jgi:hypothetical protein